MRYGEDWNEVRARVSCNQKLEEMVTAIEEEVNQWIVDFYDCPQVISGWGHQYFCEEDGGKLIFDIKKPYSHICSVCGRTYSGGVYDGAWINIYRYEAILSVLKAAILFKLKDNIDYLNYAERVLLFYSQHYDAFEVHGKGDEVAGKGKIMPQALNEAIFLVKAVHALELLKNDLNMEVQKVIINKLLKPGAWFVENQKHRIHNICCWINAAVGMVGFYTGDRALIDGATRSAYGSLNQLKQGVTQDYFWYEGSIHYNCFTLESFANLLLFAKLYGEPMDAEMEIVREMFLAAYRYAFDNLTFPNPNDGWPNISLKTYSFLFEMAEEIYQTQEFQQILTVIYSNPIERYSVPLSPPYYYKDYSLETLLYGKAQHVNAKVNILSKSHNFATSNFAVLKNDCLNTFIKYGHRTPSHAHPDKMNIEMMAFSRIVSRDLSNCGYGARLCNEWYRTTISHNTVAADGRNHESTEEGCTVQYDEVQGMISAAAIDVYKGIDFRRTIAQDGAIVRDSFHVVSSESHTYDWVFHGDGSLKIEELELTEGNLGYTENGYQHLRDIRQVSVRDCQEITLSWDFGMGVVGKQKIDLTDKQIFLCKTYDNPVNHLRDTVIIRYIGKTGSFDIQWCFEQQVL
ncbi:MAG: heparinase II/III domain-containing protein [Bacillota bacterium]